MAATVRTWRPYGDGYILDRDEPVTGPAIRAYAMPVDRVNPDDGHAARWEVTAESPYGAISMVCGTCEDLRDAKEEAGEALARLVAGGPEVAS